MATTLANDRISIAELAGAHWDILVIGGGITGAGIFREASRRGMRVLLVERADFASGTSSHSAKLIHGGLHYLQRLQVGVALSSVRARDRLMQSGPGLIEPLDFLLPFHEAERRKALIASFGLSVYEVMSGRFHRPEHVQADRLYLSAPGIDPTYVEALRYTDAQTDDVRLTMRVLAEGRRNGGVALNYVEALAIKRDHHGALIGAEVHDWVGDQTAMIHARFVANAAGPWANRLRASPNRRRELRLVRGSHLIFPSAAIPVTTAIASAHVESGLPLYIVPWRGVTIVGTTHIENGDSLERPARASEDEIGYLLRGAQAIFPDRSLSRADVRSCYSGYRPIVDMRQGEASKASRDFAIWEEDGLITVTGGKLTTFHTMACQALRIMSPRSSRTHTGTSNGPPLDGIPDSRECEDETTGLDCQQAAARYGVAAMIAMRDMPASEHRPLSEDCDITLAQIRWSARAEDVHHLDDLLFRRTRLGLVTPDGGLPLLDAVKPVALSELGWSEQRWLNEVAAYRRKWRAQYCAGVRLNDDRDASLAIIAHIGETENGNVA